MTIKEVVNTMKKELSKDITCYRYDRRPSVYHTRPNRNIRQVRKTLMWGRQHCHLSICFHFCWAWQKLRNTDKHRIRDNSKLDQVNSADSAFIIFEVLYNCFKYMPHVFFRHLVICQMLAVSGTWLYAVFVYLCTCIFVFACLTYGNIICDILE